MNAPPTPKLYGRLRKLSASFKSPKPPQVAFPTHDTSRPPPARPLVGFDAVPHYEVPDQYRKPPRMEEYGGYLRDIKPVGILNDIQSRRDTFAETGKLANATKDELQALVARFRDFVYLVIPAACNVTVPLDRSWEVEKKALYYLADYTMYAGFGSLAAKPKNLYYDVLEAMDDCIEVTKLLIHVVEPDIPAAVTRPKVRRILRAIKSQPTAHISRPMPLQPRRLTRSTSGASTSQRPTPSLVSVAPSSAAPNKSTDSMSIKNFVRSRAWSHHSRPPSSSPSTTSTLSTASSQSSQLRSGASVATSQARRQMLAENHDYARPTDDGSPIIGCYVRGVAAFSPPKDIVDFTEVAIHWTTNKDGNKLPTGASLPGLVDLLVTEFGPETERTRDSILLAFRFFCTPVHLASMFEDRWKNLQKASPESRPAEGLAIIRALLRWLQQYWRDEHDVRAIAVIEHLFQDHIKLCDEIPEDVRDALQQAIQYVLDHPWCKTGGSASGACGTAIPASKFVMPEKPVTDLYTLRLQPKFVREFAQQLVRKSSKLYRAIDGLEWTVYAKIAENKSWSIHGQAVRDFIAYRHRINLWVLKDLLAETTPINRARVIEFWIDVAQTCLSYGDFSTMYSIVWALSQAFIRNVMCVSFLLVGYRRKLCLREMDTYMEVCKREVDGSVRADRMLEAVESKGTPAIPDPGNLTLLTGQIRFKKIVLEGSLKAGRPMVNLKFASHVQVFVKRIQKFQAPYEFAAKPDAVVRFMIEHHLSKFAYEDVTAGGHDRYLQSLHNQCHERTAEPKVFECHGTKITLTSDNVIQYCIAGRMKVLHIDEYDPPDKEIYKSELFRNIDMKIWYA